LDEDDSKASSVSERAARLICGDDIEPADVKCILVLTNRHEMVHGFQALQGIASKSGKHTAIGGAIGHFVRRSGEEVTIQDLAMDLLREDFNSEPEIEEDDDVEDGKGQRLNTTKGLVFAGKGVKAASVMLEADVTTVKGVEKALQPLKKVGFNEAKSCAFMFACCGRGRGLYKGKKDVESRAFASLFPRTPLIGLFGGGEVGAVYVPDDHGNYSCESSPPKRKKEDPYTFDELLHAYTTVFVMLSFE